VYAPGTVVYQTAPPPVVTTTVVSPGYTRYVGPAPGY
jgi:hypothetical protein